MEKGICLLTVVPVRAEPKDQAEIVTQLLFGDLLQVLDSDKQWRKIQMEYDGYQGWVDEKQIQLLDQGEHAELIKSKPQITNDHNRIDIGNKTIQLVIGSSLYSEVKGQKHVPAIEIKPQEISKSEFLKVISQFIGAPYLWGGKTTFGIDCSGFTQIVFKIFGVKLLRDASQQATQGKEISFKDVQFGDVAFFHNSKGKITHVGILLDDNKIAHASGEVRIDQLTHEGILHRESNKLTHEFNCIKRFIDLS